MKKILSLILALLTVFAFVSCSGGKGDDFESGTDGSAASGVPEEKVEFSVGYSRVDISPDKSQLPILAAESSSEYFRAVKDPLYATCIALSDGTSTALILTLDIKGTYDYIQKGIMKAVREATSLDVANIMISATHNHSAPASSDDGNKEKFSWDDGIYDWIDTKIFAQMGQLAKDAIADLAPAEIYTSKADTTGMAYVRRYLHEDGRYTAIQNRVGEGNSTPIVAHESDADAQLQIIKFDREEKKDIVLSNWQAHVAHAVGIYPDMITADLVYYVRSGVEAQSDVLYAYYAGASGNVNLTAKVPIEGVEKYANYIKVGEGLADLINVALETAMNKVEAGKIKTSRAKVICSVVKDTNQRIAEAQEIIDSGYDSGLMKKYGFISSYEVNAVKDRSTLGTSEEVPIGVISFGDVAFVSAPYEMFDTSGMQIKSGSPFETTFVLSCAGGNYDYMPDKFAHGHGGYEVFRCRYVKGTAERLVSKYLEILEEHKQ